MKTTTNIYDIITERILNLLDNAGKYQKKWVSTKNGFAFNPVTKHFYEGINQLLLSFYIEEGNYKTNKWLTFAQASEKGGKIIKGEKGHQIVYFNYTYKTKDGEKLTATQYDNLSPENKSAIVVSSFIQMFYVFNVAQIEGLEESFYLIDDIKYNSFNPIEQLENLASNYILQTGISLIHAGQDVACYYPETDGILMPLKEQFISSESYYKTFFHECSHSTGHQTRLNRKGIAGINDLDYNKEEYAFEELVAELSTAFVNARFGIETEITNNAAYIKSWMTHLKNDNRFFVKASGMANKAANYIIEYSHEKSLAA